MKSITILGVSYRIVEGVELDDAEGMFDAEAGELQISKTVPAARRWSVLRHEIGHAVSFESGFRDRLREQFRLAPEDVTKLEEALVGHFLPAFVETLEGAGFTLVDKDEAPGCSPSRPGHAPRRRPG